MIAVHYQVYDVELHDYLTELIQINKVVVPRVNTILVRAKPSTYFEHRRFDFVGIPGEVLYFMNTSCISCNASCMVYDGFLLYHKLLDIYIGSQQTVEISQHTRYFRAYIIVQFLSIDRTLRQTWRMGISRRQVKSVEVTSAYTIKLDNTRFDSIVNSVLSVNFSAGKFPILSIKSHISDGFNDDSCSYGGFLLTQSRNGSMLTNDTYGPYCSRLLIFQPFQPGSGLSELVFSGDPFIFFVYAFGPLYDLVVDIKVAITTCEGLINPLKAWFDNSTNPVVPFDVELQKPNYRCYCEGAYSSKSYGGIYAMIVMYGLQGCIVLQQIPSASDISYIIRLTMDADVTTWIISPVFTDAIMNITHWDYISISPSSVNKIQSTVNGPITHRDISNTVVQYLTQFAFHKRMYYVMLASKNVVHKCNRYNESSHIVWKDVFPRFRYFLSCDTACGIGNYTKNNIYIFSFVSVSNSLAHVRGKFIEYISIATIIKPGCTSKKQTNKITITLHGHYTSTIPMTNRYLNITLYSILYVLITEKNNPCCVVALTFNYSYFQLLAKITSHQLKVNKAS